MSGSQEGHKGFAHFAKVVAHWTGRPWCFVSAVLIIGLWAASGWIFDFSDTWQLVINTGTTIVTFLMVFLIQNTQNRDTASMQIKLDELIRANEHARNALLNLEEMDEQQLETIQQGYEKMARQAESHLRERRHRQDEAGRHSRSRF